MNILTLNSDFSKFLFNLNLKLSKPQRNHLLSFTEGLLNFDGKKNLSKIFQHSFNSKDRSSFNKFFLYSPWNEDEFNQKRKQNTLKKMIEINKNKPFLFSIDDTLSIKNKSSKKIEGLKFNFSHVSGKSEWSHSLVALHGSSNGISLPLDFKPYLSKEMCFKENKVFENKIQLAIKTLKDITIQLQRKSFVLVDSWYTSAEFINETQKLGFQVIGGLKSNRIFYPKGIRSKLNEFVKLIEKKDIDVVTVNGRKHYVYRYEGMIKGVENVIILISWLEKYEKTKKPFYIVSTDTSLNNREIIKYYNHRWEIEVSFRYFKERLGLDNYEMRKFKGIKRFWSLIYLIYDFLEIRRYKDYQEENLGKVIDKIKNLRKKEIIDYIYKEALLGKEKQELYKEFKVLA